MKKSGGSSPVKHQFSDALCKGKGKSKGSK